MSGLYLDHYLGRNAQKGYNTMAGRKNGVTDSTCESLVPTQPYPHSKMRNAKTYLPIPGA